MKHTFFEIRNFKGIDHLRLDLNTKPQNNVFTLVGLNESGKTTILEALNFFTYKAETLDPLDLPGYSVEDVHELIPMGKRFNFNDNITITVGYALDDGDIKAIRNYLRDELAFEWTKEFREFSIEQRYVFAASRLAQSRPNLTWRGMKFDGKKKRTKRETALPKPDLQKTVEFMQTLLPSVLYFPNFLFEFPDRIYLEATAGSAEDKAKHELYRTILQDVLNSLEGDMTLEKHVLTRAKSDERPDKVALESVLLKMGSNISKTVFESWNRIFKRNVGRKEIVVDCDKDEAGDYFLQLRLRDGNELYTISDRSLGFRWFFAFLLLTQYRGFRKDAPKNVLFLLDEPASNLHSSAQAQLLKSFGNFPDDTSIIYTTHSHHMINPEWLEGTFVVKNAGLDYDAAEDDYNARNTLVTLDRYRNFASQHPRQTTYFQPILDVLDYQPSTLENVPNVVMVEGKYDFYALKYFHARVGRRLRDLHLMPGSGAGSLGNVIRLYLAWGREFVILLDSDAAGAKEKQRYEEEFGPILKDKIFTLEDIDPAWQKLGIEFLAEEADRLGIQNTAYPTATKFNKTHFNRALQELFLTKQQVPLSPATEANFTKVLTFLNKRLLA